MPTNRTLGILIVALFGACAFDDGDTPPPTSSTLPVDTGTGDGNGDGDGDGDPGDGDPGDGDGDPGDGDHGDGDPGDGDGDGDPGDGDPGDGDGDHGMCPNNFADCNALTAAFDAETIAIRSCSGNDDCGMALVGTSCGCTRDWIARLGADTTCFYDIIDAAQQLQCDLPLASTCDCPEADGFICDQGICNWNYL